MKIPITSHTRWSRKSGGFTLVEVLLAVVIFSMVIGAVYSTFNSAMKIYRTGTLEKQVFQEARMLQNITMRDLRSSLAIEETFYDIPPFALDTTEQIDFSTDTSWVQDESNYSQNLYPFLGTTSTMSFYCYSVVPLGLIRGIRQGTFQVKYSFDNLELLREATEQNGNISEKEDLVHRLTKCEFSFGYKKEGQIFWNDKWDSRRDDNRTPKNDEEVDSFFDPERKKAIRVYPDNLPDAVRILLVMKDPENPASEGREFEWLCEIPSAKPSIVKEEKKD
jgi:prepilin-type N-terminal cleavage/methylation domain-containing protein